MFSLEPQTLIVVYKDEFVLNQLKKLVESKDDADEENPTGTRDGSIQIVAWDEKVWADQKKAGNITNKVLFLGDIKGVKDLLPVLDICFSEHGVTFGTAGRQAALVIDPSKVADARAYNAFLEDLEKYNLPEALKAEKRKEEEGAVEEKQPTSFFAKLGNGIKKTSKAAIKGAKDFMASSGEKVRRQLYFYGVNRLYESALASFMEE